MAKLKGVLKRVGADWWQLPRQRSLDLKTGPNKGKYNTPTLRRERLRIRIRSKDETDAMRREFASAGGPRHQFMEHVQDRATVTDLQAMGMTSGQAKRFKETGDLPSAFQVHHRIPLKGGGTNEAGNLVLIKNTPDHQLMTAMQNSILKRYPDGVTIDVELPTTPPGAITWPRSGQAAYKR